jgi:hypothetical protein
MTTTQTVRDHVGHVDDRPWFRALSRIGMATRGVVYLIIGVLAVMVATGTGGETTDQRGALDTVAEQPFGNAMLLALAVGLGAYALWRVVQGVLDTDDKGDGPKDLAVRATKVGSGVAHGVLCVFAVQLLVGSGEGGGGGSTQQRTAGVLGMPGGRAIVLAAAAVVLGVAGWNLYRGVTRSFMKRLHPTGRERGAVEAIGAVGMTARAVVFGLIAVFLAKAAVEYEAREAVGLDGALARLRDQPYGPYLLGAVALGLVAFAVYCFAEARHREI